MGRLPATFADREIKDRFPYEMPAEQALTTGQRGVQFTPAVFNNGTDKPFECHRLIARVYARDSTNLLLNPQPAQELLSGLVRMEILIDNLEQRLTKAPALIDATMKGTSERTWEFADPCYLVRSSAFQVTVDALTFPANGVISNLNNLLVALTFQGFLLIIAPPMPNR